jgi:hypothetical protein
MARSGHRKMACSPDAARAGAVMDLGCPSPDSLEAPMPLINVRLIEEVKSGDWAIGGRPVTTEAVRALARGDLSLPV